jgi:hypothetical protein
MEKIKNKRGGIGISIVLSIFVFICFLPIVNILTSEVTNFRVAMDCSNIAGISDGTKLVCLAISDTIIVYFIFLVFSVSIGLILERLVF